ncbi:SHOCT domain-containing protein [Paenibacillus sp. Soil522]|uniref:SHOCT domain-containing protein n=1 Tax=Paenibacillus sp. Soil522 TaxID=1736388 RepID=UPI0006FD7128|nr:SHOCT domain-containing protein [Paenibacillus sp. Soil522]KRE45834.1 hypothetical protein ASG81_12465 [Paenibacillus sp. Soil522]
MKSVMKFIKEVEGKLQIYCDECGMVKEVPSTQCAKSQFSPYINCICGNEGKLLSGRQKKKESILNAIITLVIGVGITIWLFTLSSLIGWISLVFFLLITLGFLAGQDDTEAHKKGKILDTFNSHKSKLVNSNAYYISCDMKSALCIDSVENKICVMSSELNIGKVYSSNDILEVEIVEDGKSVINTSRGSQVGGALIGAVLAGGVGAIVGGLSGKKIQSDTVNRIDMKLLLNDIENPVIMINFMNDFNFATKTKNKEGERKDSRKYKEAIELVTHWHGLVSVLIKRADDGDNASNQKNYITNFSIADELTKLVELHKNGILTQEEFELQKNKVLS